MPTDIQLKVTVAKLIELSIDQDRDLALKIIRSKAGFRISVDQDGHATLSGKAGVLAFKGDPALTQIGAAVKFVSVSFGHGEDGRVVYSGSFRIGFASIVVSGNFDIEKLITSCSGLLCRAARALRDRPNVLRHRELEELMRQ